MSLTRSPARTLFVEGKGDPACGAKIVPSAGNRWQRKIPRRRFHALAGSTFGRARRADSIAVIVGTSQRPHMPIGSGPRAKPNPQAAALVLLVRLYPETLERLEKVAAGLRSSGKY